MKIALVTQQPVQWLQYFARSEVFLQHPHGSQDFLSSLQSGEPGSVVDMDPGEEETVVETAVVTVPEPEAFC